MTTSDSTCCEEQITMKLNDLWKHLWDQKDQEYRTSSWFMVKDTSSHCFENITLSEAYPKPVDIIVAYCIQSNIETVTGTTQSHYLQRISANMQNQKNDEI